jgi:dTDP-4-dehydrorhamnose 3,5-epimerase
MNVERLAISDVLLIRPPRFGDSRGFFSETYSRRQFAAIGVDLEFVQDNHSLSAQTGTVRGLHFQTPPQPQAKLVRVVRGAVLDVAVDLRHGAPTYGRHVTARLTGDGGEQMFVPVGFAHGFCTLEPDTEVIYKVSGYYDPTCDRGLAWDDPALGIDWPVAAAVATLSDKDRRQPKLADLPVYFTGAG